MKTEEQPVRFYIVMRSVAPTLVIRLEDGRLFWSSVWGPIVKRGEKSFNQYMNADEWLFKKSFRKYT